MKLRRPSRTGSAAELLPLGVVLDHVPFAVIVVQRGGEVVHMNRRAERLVATRDGFAIRRSRLSVVDRKGGRALRLLLDDAAGSDGDRHIGIGGACRLRRPSGKPAYEALLVPLHRDGGSAHWSGHRRRLPADCRGDC